jgi:hypothetical protein
MEAPWEAEFCSKVRILSSLAGRFGWQPRVVLILPLPLFFPPRSAGSQLPPEASTGRESERDEV